jgi:chemotaxis protein histidine kinase CheA
MSGRLRIVAWGVALAVVVGFPVLSTFSPWQRQVQAAPAPAAAKRIEAMNSRAIAAFESGDSESAKQLLLDAVVLGKMNGLDTHASVARSYLNLGLVHIDGLKDQAKGERYFAAALRIDPSIQMKAGVANPDVARAFERARAQAAKDRENQASAEAETEKAAAKLDEAAAAPVAAAPKGPSPAELKKAQERDRRERDEQDKILKGVAEARDKEARQREQDARAREQKAREERDKILTGVAQAREKEAKDREQSALQERDKVKEDLRATEAREKQERADREKVEAERQRLQGEKERLLADKERLQKEKADLEKQLAEAKQQGRDKERKDLDEKQHVQKEKQEVEKRLAQAEEREKKEREAKEKLQEEKKQALAREQEAKAKLQEEKRLAQAREQQVKDEAAREQQARAHLAEGPELPANIPQKLFCSVPDESPPGADVHVHCVPPGQIKAEQITLYYRPSGSPRFNTMAMERNRKGWYAAMIPAALIKGSMLQYYVEAQNERGRTVVSNGKPALPNVAMVNRPSAVAQATGTNTGLVKARARSGRRDQAR